jgi:hypothetical protein
MIYYIMIQERGPSCVVCICFKQDSRHTSVCNPCEYGHGFCEECVCGRVAVVVTLSLLFTSIYACTI